MEAQKICNFCNQKAQIQFCNMQARTEGKQSKPQPIAPLLQKSLIDYNRTTVIILKKNFNRTPRRIKYKLEITEGIQQLLAKSSRKMGQKLHLS